MEVRGEAVYFVEPAVRSRRIEKITREDGTTYLRAFDAPGSDRCERRVDARGVPHEKAWHWPNLPKAAEPTVAPATLPPVVDTAEPVLPAGAKELQVDVSKRAHRYGAGSRT